MDQSLAIVFAGTPEFADPSLRALLDTGHRVIAVYTQPDRQAGRGRRLSASPVKRLALERGIPLRQPSNFRQERDIADLEALHADLIVVVAYGLILPRRVLDAPRLGCVNVHASLLPRWRGAAPIQRAIQSGDAETGVTIMQMEEGLDSGPILLRRRCTIGDHETGGSLHDRLSILGAEALIDALPAIADGSVRPQPQDDRQACYASKLAKGEASIDWSHPAATLARLVRAFNPWPVAHTRLQGETLRIWDASELAGEVVAAPGSVVAASSQGIDVATGEGLLRIRMLQLPGRNRISAADFLNARDLSGVRFGD